MLIADISPQYPYRFLYLKNIPADKAIAINSAAGVASQIPLTPNIRGSTTIVTSMNTKDLENASAADTTPFDSAVNIPLAKILKPINSNAMVQILLPVTARLYTGLSGRAKIDTKDSVKKKEKDAVKTEITAITFRLDDTNCFILA